MNFEQKYNEYLALIEQALKAYLDSIKEKSIVSEAMAYSLMNGGKRVRPVLALAFCELLGADVKRALPFACAVEMVHTYSLIHDDLPCMDNDDMRRGKPSCHKQFGEAFALLAGDGLLTLAFQTAADAFPERPDLTRKCLQRLALGAGVDGMIGGQVIDLLSEDKTIDYETLKKLHALKTGQLLSTPCELGVLCAGGGEQDLQRAAAFGAAIGLQFQIVDDILDKTGNQEELGKPIGSDEVNRKSTYVTLLGLENAQAQVSALGKQAREVLNHYGEKAAFLRRFTFRLEERKK